MIFSSSFSTSWCSSTTGSSGHGRSTSCNSDSSSPARFDNLSVLKDCPLLSLNLGAITFVAARVLGTITAWRWTCHFCFGNGLSSVYFCPSFQRWSSLLRLLSDRLFSCFYLFDDGSDIAVRAVVTRRFRGLIRRWAGGWGVNIRLVCRSSVLEILTRGFHLDWLSFSNNFILVSFEHVCSVELGNDQRISFKVWLILKHHLY